MIRPFKYITSQHVVAGVTVMPQKRFRTKSKESPKRVLKHIWKDSTGLVQSEILAGRRVAKLAFVTCVSSIFFTSATCVNRQTFNEAKLMFMASSVKEYHMFSLSLLFFVNSVSWIMIRVGHDVSRGGIES